MWTKTALTSPAKRGAQIINGTGGISVKPFSSETKSDVPAIPSPTRSGLQASYARGTGGRQSFSGNVCTVFGSSGFLGRYIVNRLGKEGSQVIIPYRADPYYVRDLKTAGDLGQILFFPFDLKDEDSIRKVVRYSNVVINLIGRDFETRNYPFNEVNAIGAGRIARISREMGVKRLIHFSAMNATMEPEEHFIPGGSQFLKSKALGETFVRDEFPDAVIVRPCDIHGWFDRFFWSYAYTFRKNFFHHLSMYRCGEYSYKAPVHCFNVAQGVMRILHDPTSDGKTFEFTGPYWYQLGDLMDWMFKVLHRYEDTWYTRCNMDAWTSFKTNLMEFKRAVGKRQMPWDWEKIERTECTSDVLTGCPTLMDLGVDLFPIEDKVPRTIKYFDRLQWYFPEIGEYPDPPYAKRLPPLRKKPIVPYSDRFETTVNEPPVDYAT